MTQPEAEHMETHAHSDSAQVPGVRLKAAREARGLSLDEVAQLLKLDVDKIAALEHDEVGHIVAPVYVAGYLRAYAKLLDLPADDIVTEFEALRRMASPTIDPTVSPAGQNFGKVSDGNGGEQLQAIPIWLWGVVLVVALVLIGFYGPWFNSDRGSDGTELTTAPQLEVPLPQINGDTADETMMSSAAAPAVEEPATAAPADSEISEQPAAGSEVSHQPAAGSEVSHQPAAVSEVSEQPAAVSEVAAQPQSELSLYFNDDSWVEVTDATGQRLVYRLAKAGMARTVQGVAPFEVQLGYVPGVDIMYNGKPFDLSPYANRRSVHLRVGRIGDGMNNSE